MGRLRGAGDARGGDGIRGSAKRESSVSDRHGLSGNARRRDRCLGGGALQDSTKMHRGCDYGSYERAPNGKKAIRDTFEGLESLFKRVTDDNKDLSSSNVAQLLQAIVSRAHAGTDAIAQGAAEQVVQSFRDRVNACHKYRHGHDQPEPVEPPLDLAIVLVGSGLNYARWLATFAA